jgi:hypothetical protein
MPSPSWSGSTTSGSNYGSDTTSRKSDPPVVNLTSGIEPPAAPSVGGGGGAGSGVAPLGPIAPPLRPGQ